MSAFAAMANPAGAKNKAVSVLNAFDVLNGGTKRKTKKQRIAEAEAAAAAAEAREHNTRENAAEAARLPQWGTHPCRNFSGGR